MPKQDCKCSVCGVEREVVRKKATPENYSFWCIKCQKEVKQAEPIRKFK